MDDPQQRLSFSRSQIRFHRHPQHETRDANARRLGPGHSRWNNLRAKRLADSLHADSVRSKERGFRTGNRGFDTEAGPSRVNGGNYRGGTKTSEPDGLYRLPLGGWHYGG